MDVNCWTISTFDIVRNFEILNSSVNIPTLHKVLRDHLWITAIELVALELFPEGGMHTAGQALFQKYRPIVYKKLAYFSRNLRNM